MRVNSALVNAEQTVEALTALRRTSCSRVRTLGKRSWSIGSSYSLTIPPGRIQRVGLLTSSSAMRKSARSGRSAVVLHAHRSQRRELTSPLLRAEAPLKARAKVELTCA